MHLGMHSHILKLNRLEASAMGKPWHECGRNAVEKGDKRHSESTVNVISLFVLITELYIVTNPEGVISWKTKVLISTNARV
jgi:hypothetical protein